MNTDQSIIRLGVEWSKALAAQPEIIYFCRIVTLIEIEYLFVKIIGKGG